MKFNDFFNRKRFGQLVKHDLLINQNKYLLKMLVLFLGMYASMVYLMYNNPILFCDQQLGNHQIQPQGYVRLFIFGLIALGIFVGGAFSDLGSKTKRTSFMLLPASNFEKLLHPFLLRVVLGIACFLLFFWVDAHLARLTVTNAPSLLTKTMVLAPFSYAQIVTIMGKDDFAMISLALFSFGMYLFVVPLFFKKQALLKAILFFFVGLYAYISFFVLLSKIFHPGLAHGFNFQTPGFDIAEDLTIMEFFVDSIACISWAFLLLLGYFKLKELKL